MRSKSNIVTLRTIIVGLMILTAFLVWEGLRNWVWVEHESRYIDFAMQLVTILAFIIAFVAYWDAQEQGNQLRAVHDAVNTKYVNEFPEYLKTLVDDIRKANEFVYILWDAADIGSYVDHDLHEELVGELVQASCRIRKLHGDRKDGKYGKYGVKFLIMGKPKAISRAGNNSIKNEKAKEFCDFTSKKSEFCGMLSKLYEKYKNTEDLDSSCYEKIESFSTNKFSGNFDQNAAHAFEIYQLCYHDFIATGLQFQSIDVKVYNEQSNDSNYPSNFFWITDNGRGGDQAGVVLLTPNHDAPAFSTTDQHLTKCLIHIFDASFKNAKPYQEFKVS